MTTRALSAKNLADCREAVRQFLAISDERQKRFFVGEKRGYKEPEDIFLLLEGLVMLAQYKTARDRAPKGEDWFKTLITLAQRTDSRSQETGLGLFLLIERLVPNWKPQFLSPNPNTLFVLREAISKNTIELIRKNKKPVVLYCVEADDLYPQTLTKIKRLIEVIQGSGNILSVLLMGHPKLRNDLRCPTMEEIGCRIRYYSLDNIVGNLRDYIEWLLKSCTAKGTKIADLIDTSAIELLVSK